MGNPIVTKITVEDIPYKIKGTLYDELGNNTDGGVTQAALTGLFNNVDLSLFDFNNKTENFKLTSTDGFYIIDSTGNICLTVNGNGVFDVLDIGVNIRSKIGSITSESINTAITTVNEAIDSIDNDVSKVNSKLSNYEITSEDGFRIVDPDGNICFIVSRNGMLDALGLGNNLTEIINNMISSGSLSVTTHEIALDIEYGGLTFDGSMTGSDARTAFFNLKRTKNFIKRNTFELTLTNCTAQVYMYDSSFSFIRIVDYATYIENPSSYSFYAYKLLFTITDTANDMNVVYEANDCQYIKNQYTSLTEISFVYEVQINIGKDVLDDDPTIERLIEDKYYNTGFIKLPPNYSQTGSPSPLILFAHSSADYGSIGTSVMTTNYAAYYEYLQKEGYAIFDCYGSSNYYASKYNLGYSVSLGTPTNMSCINAAYKWVCEHYNVDTSGIYVTGKSLGGIICFAMLYQNSIPVRCVGALAPSIDARYLSEYVFGYREEAQNFCFEDLGFDVNDGDTNETILLNNIDKCSGFINSLRNITYAEINNTQITSQKEIIRQLINVSPTNAKYSKLERICNVPIKIFIANDDNIVNPTGCKYFINSIKATGGDAEIRIFPSGCGKHHAVDTGIVIENGVPVQYNQPKVNITTKLGYNCSDVPLAYAELVQYFRKY